MPKTELSALLGRLPSAEPTRSIPKPPPAPSQPPYHDAGAQPRFLSFVRKDTRIRDDQLESLTAHARRLNRLKATGPRVTENTLIRVAIDLLLGRIDRASGSSEDEIRRSLQ